MRKAYDVIALGELLIDMTNNGVSERGNSLFEANPGGAPCNVLAILNKLNRKVGFIGKVGDDIFGHKLKKVLDEVGIDTRNLIIDKDARTTLAFVQTFEDGDRDFSFYRNPGADMMLKKQDIDVDLLRDTKVFHFGTISMTHEDVREATKFAIEEAKKAGAIISFDPNLREPLWNCPEDAKEQVLYGLTKCDVLKIADNEIQWLTGEKDYTAGVKKIREICDIPLITVSLGKKGSRAYYKQPASNGKEIIIEVEPFLQKHTIETTGAGDTFSGCILHYIIEKGLHNLQEEDLREMLTFANGAASIITTRNGALKVMPEPEEVTEMIKQYRGQD